jgi:hypothetical protein
VEKAFRLDRRQWSQFRWLYSNVVEKEEEEQVVTLLRPLPWVDRFTASGFNLPADTDGR